MVWGKYAEELCRLNNTSSFGEGSPFDFLYQKQGVQITIGNTANVACTQIHHCEALAKVPYRKEKKFTGSYIDCDGSESQRTYSMYVRPLNALVSNEAVNEPHFTKTLVEQGILTNKDYDGIINCRRYDLRKLTDYVLEDLTEGDGSFVVSVNGVPGYKNSGVCWDELIC
jgi:aminoglycoside N3'-acetyltransferase